MPYLGRDKTGEGRPKSARERKDDLFPVRLGTAGDIARSGLTDSGIIAMEKMRLTTGWDKCK